MIHPELPKVWSKLSIHNSMVFLVVLEDYQFIIEPPTLSSDELFSNEATLRLFIDPQIAEWYCDQLRMWYPNLPLEVKPILLRELFELSDELQAASHMEHGCGANFAVCKIQKPQGEAEIIDVIYAAEDALN